MNRGVLFGPWVGLAAQALAVLLAVALLAGAALTKEGIRFTDGHSAPAVGTPLRVDNWKLVNGQLYALSADLSETRNLAKEQPDRVKAMTVRLRELMKPRPGQEAEP